MEQNQCRPLALDERDIIEAMRELSGYLDVTPEDLSRLFRLAYHHALDRLTGGVTVSKVMTREVVCVESGQTLLQVAETMASKGVSGVPVLQEGMVVGVIAESDFLSQMGGGEKSHFMEVLASCLASRPCLAAPLRSKTAAEVMSAPAVSVSPDAPLSQATEILRRNKINRAPVIDQGGRLVGIVTRADIMRLFRLWSPELCGE